MLLVRRWSEARPARRAGSGVGKYVQCRAQNSAAKGSTLLRRRGTLPIWVYYLSTNTSCNLAYSNIITFFIIITYTSTYIPRGPVVDGILRAGIKNMFTVFNPNTVVGSSTLLPLPCYYPFPVVIWYYVKGILSLPYILYCMMFLLHHSSLLFSPIYCIFFPIMSYLLVPQPT